MPPTNASTNGSGAGNGANSAAYVNKKRTKKGGSALAGAFGWLRELPSRRAAREAKEQRRREGLKSRDKVAVGDVVDPSAIKLASLGAGIPSGGAAAAAADRAEVARAGYAVAPLPPPVRGGAGGELAGRHPASISNWLDSHTIPAPSAGAPSMGAPSAGVVNGRVRSTHSNGTPPESTIS
eukprot:356004-Chlamydomonas_euryale.AAC.7